MGVGVSAFLYFLLRVSILLSLSSSPSGIEESTLYGVICVIGLVGGSNFETGLVTTWGVSESVSSRSYRGSVSYDVIGISSGGSSEIVTLFLGLLFGVCVFVGDFVGDLAPTILGNLDLD